MEIVIGIVLGFALLVVAAASLSTNIKLWGVGKDVVESLSNLPRDQRQRVFRRSAVMYVLIGGYAALFIIHPFGLRDTFLWFLIVPFLIAAPLGVLATGICAWRRPLHEPKQPKQPHAEHPDDRRI